MPERPAPTSSGTGAGDRLTVETKFAIVPQWLLEAPVSDAAVRLYGLLARYGNSSGRRMPSRQTLADSLRRSKDSVDRALRELEGCGAVVVQRRRDGTTNLTNLYQLRTSPPGAPEAPRPRLPAAGGARSRAATRRALPCPHRPSVGEVAAPVRPPRTKPLAATGGRTRAGSRSPAATPGRTDAARVAAPVRPDPDPSTQTPPPPKPPAGTPPPRAPAEAGGGGSLKARPHEAAEPPGDWAPVLASVGLDYGPPFQDLIERVVAARLAAGHESHRWRATHLIDALRDAVLDKHWPADCAVPALLHLAGDRTTASPMRLGCPGPWWDRPPRVTGTNAAEGRDELERLEALLADADGRRPALQRRAREQLHRAGVPLTRVAVARHAVHLLGAADAPARTSARLEPAGTAAPSAAKAGTTTAVLSAAGRRSPSESPPSHAG